MTMTSTPTAAQRAAALRSAWAVERSLARAARRSGDHAAEWHHLERAHILSQPLAWPHVRTHLDMLGYGIRKRDRREIVGQLVRVLVAGPGSWTGKYPLGNTGGANVSAVAPMPLPDDLQPLLGRFSMHDGPVARSSAHSA